MKNIRRFPLLIFMDVCSAGFWVYPFLDWDQGGLAAGLYIGVAACFIVVFFIQMLFHFIRDWIAKITGRNTVANKEQPQQEMTEHHDLEAA